MNRRRFAEQSSNDDDNNNINVEDIVIVAVDVNNHGDHASSSSSRNQRHFDNSYDDTSFSYEISDDDALASTQMMMNPNNNNISSSIATTTGPDPISYEWRILWLILSMSIFITGGVANILTAYVILYTSRAMRRASYVLIAGVAVADVWMCLLAHPSEVVASACAFLWHTCALPAWWCPVNETLLEIFSCTSILAQMWVAVNRGIAVFAPYFYRAHMRSVRVSAHLLIFGAFVPSVLFNGPGLFGLIFVHIRNETLGDCKHISPIAMIMQIHFGLCYAGPTAVSIAIYLAIFMKIVISTSPRVRTMAASMLKYCRRFVDARRKGTRESPNSLDKTPVQQPRPPIENGTGGQAADVSTLSSNSSASSKSGDDVAHVNGTPFSARDNNTGLSVTIPLQQLTASPPTTAALTTTALRRHAQTATAMFVCVLLFAVAIVPPRILLVNDLYGRTPVLGIILKLALRTTFATNPIFYFCFNREFRAAYLRLFGIHIDPHHHPRHHHHHKNHAHQNGNGINNNNSGVNDSTNMHDNHVGRSQHSTTRHNSHTGVMHLPPPHMHVHDYHSNTNTAANSGEHVDILMPLLLQTAKLPAISTSTGSSGSSLYSSKQYNVGGVDAAAAAAKNRQP